MSESSDAKSPQAALAHESLASVIRWGFIVALVLAAISPWLPSSGPMPAWVTYGSAAVVLGVCRVLMTRGFDRPVAIAFPCFVFALSCAMLFAYGTNAAGVLGFILSVLFTGLFWRPSAALWTAGLSTLLLVGYQMSLHAGLLVQPSPVSDARVVAGSAAAMVVSALIIRTALRANRLAIQLLQRNEHLLKLSERKHALLVEASPDGMVSLSPTGIVKSFNPAAEEITGRQAEEIIGKRFTAVSVLAPGQGDVAVAEFTRVASGSKRPPAVVRLVRPDGTERFIEAHGRLVTREDGTTEIHATMRDVTVRVGLEKRLEQSQRLEALGQMAGGVAHDFNNVLSVLLSTATALLEQESDAGGRRDGLEEIVEASERAAGLTRQLLAFSRRQRLEPKALDLTETMRNLETMLERIIGEDIELEMLTDPDLAVNVDPSSIEQAIINLAANARAAMPNGGKLRIAARAWDVDASPEEHADVAAGSYVRIEVEDTGTGMSEQARARAFEPFFTTKGAEGTGLGLAMVHGFVRQSEGYVWIDSVPSEGTTITIALPRHERADVQAAPASTSSPPSNSRSVLLVEDDDLVRRASRRALEALGHDVVTAEGPRQALALASHRSFDVVITDVVMPEMNGVEFAQQLIEREPSTRVLFLSGYTPDGDLPLHRHRTRFLAKPCRTEELAREIETLMRT